MRILVVRFRRVGDALLSTTVCRSLKKSYPKAEIHYVLNEGIAELFAKDPYIDKLITFSTDELQNPLKYLIKVWKLVRANQYSIIVDLRTTLNTLPFALFSPKSKFRIGFYKPYNYLIHNYRVPTFLTSGDYIQQSLSFLNPLYKHGDIIKDSLFAIYLEENEKAAFCEKMKTKGIDFEQPIVVCSVTTRVINKRWPMEYMREIIKKIIQEFPSFQLIFNYGGKVEQKIATDLYYALGKPSQVFINIEAESLRELAAMLSCSTYFFGNEGGARHIAQAMEVPSFALFSPEISIDQWLPNRCEAYDGIAINEIIVDDGIRENMNSKELFYSITPEIVWKKLKRKLEIFVLNK